MATPFVEERLPEEISYGSSGGPQFSTSVFASASGFEQRNLLWSESRAKYNIQYGLLPKADMDTLLAFFMNMKGRTTGFRFKDWADYQITAQTIGTGDGATATFQIIKTYTAGAQTYNRTIYKPVSGTLGTITVGVTAYVEGVDFTIDYTTGIITFTTIPPDTEAIVIDTLEFDVPVRFDSDDFVITHEAWQTESAESVTVVELKLSNA